MINSLLELNNKVTEFANHVVKTACEETFSGSYVFSVEDICSECGIERSDFTKYRNFFEDELYSREEFLEVNFYTGEIDVSCGLKYCPNYEWTEGDEAIFGSFEEYTDRTVVPYKQYKDPASLNRDSDIFDFTNEIITLSSGTLTVNDLNKNQLTELKQIMYCADKSSISWAELSNIDLLVSDEAVKEYYADTLFSADDFSSSSGINNLDKMVQSAENRKTAKPEDKDNTPIKDHNLIE